MDARYDKYRKATAGISMPFAWLDLDLLEANAGAISKRAGDKLVRIASKSVRSLPVLKHLLSMHRNFQGLMCFTGPEAVWLSQNGLDDLLIAYPLWDSGHVEAICQELAKGKTIYLMVDSVEHVRHLAPIAAKHNVILPLCIDLDLSVRLPGLHFGVFRSPLYTPEAVLKVFKEIKHHSSLRLDALMGYEAQVAGLADRTPGKGLMNVAVRYLKRKSVKEVARRRKAVVEALLAEGAELKVVNGGGTGSMESTREEAAVTEITAGSGFFQSHLFDYYDNFRHEPAAGFAVQIVRQPLEGMWTCLGGGYVASGAAGKEKLPLPYLPEGAKLHPNEGAGEVQSPVLYDGPQKLKLGDPIFFRHSKAGELCERFHDLVVMKNGKVMENWKTYRGDGQCFL